ncbi:hypothetical protein FA95DRAFT_1614075 [Auriscalpium vulgare]|uniref:Uncharacterized protein n=1 Tax=Auriscalpium vulgare TaxID=40419 RepID=A0ACB8R210_9AGAM|nr:hypothetical protein FA95DRAFT_1614075 [Auriscalpium vulgare]
MEETTAASHVIEIPDDPDKVFIAAEWIGQGKIYPAIPPAHVEAQLKAVLEVPFIPRKHIVPHGLPVIELLQQNLPSQSAAFMTIKAQKWFHHDSPTDAMDHAKTTEMLLRRPVPPVQVLRMLQDTIGQAWLDGKQSIVDWSVNDGRDRLPLWSLTFWIDVGGAIRGQGKWSSCEHWITAETNSVGPMGRSTMDRAHTLLHTLPWNTPIRSPAVSTTTLELTRMLGNDWMSDELINMMFEQLASRVRLQTELTTRVVVAPLAFSEAVKRLTKATTYSPADAPLLRMYEELVYDGGRTTIYCPVHVRGNHWVAVEIDFLSRTFACGDSLEYSDALPLDFTAKLQRWFRARFGGPFKYLGNSLRHGIQQDHNSCGICTVNTVAHATLGDLLWEPARRSEERAQWFCALVEAYCFPGARASIPVQEAEMSSLHQILNPEMSVTLALGDHNFPDLATRLEIAAQADLPSHDTNVYASEASDAAANDINSLIDEGVVDSIPEDEIHGLTDLELGTSSDAMSAYDDSVAADDCASLDAMDILDTNDTNDTDLAILTSDLGDGGLSGSVKRKRADSAVVMVSKHLKTAPSADETHGVIGIGRSSVAARNNRTAAREGTFVVSQKRYDNWRDKILAQDPEAQFKAELDPSIVWHSHCQEWRRVKEPYDASRFVAHVQACKGPKKTKTRGGKDTVNKALMGTRR